MLRIENIRLFQAFFLNAESQEHAEILCEEESSAEEYLESGNGKKVM